MFSNIGGKAAGAYSRQPYHFYVPIVYKFWEPQPPGAPNDLPRPVLV
jgi:hypothetical protein